MSGKIYSNQYLNNKYTEDYLFRIKACAIVSAIAAHCTLVDNRLAHSEIARFSSNILSSIGSVGVPIFLIVSGYLYNNRKKARKYSRIKYSLFVFRGCFGEHWSGCISC